MGKVLFVSQNPLGRAENITALYDAYDGEKEFLHGMSHMLEAEVRGFSVVVCDALPQYIAFKDKCKSVVIEHGVAMGKLYGLNEPYKPWADPVAYAQTDYAITSSEAGIPVMASELGIPEEKVLPLGLPRTDAYFSGKGGGTEFAGKRIYLYAPTYRNEDLGGRIPLIDWEVVDGMLEDDEVVVVKRHYFTHRPLLGADFKRVVEAGPMEPTGKLLMDCSVLLTDYSSIMFDAYLLERPCILVLDDMEDFLKDRGMYMEYPEEYSSRWICAEGNEERLVDMMREAAENGMGDAERKCVELTAGACDGHSAERVCDLIRSLL